MGEAGQRLACAMLLLQAGQKLLSVGMVTKEQGGSFGKGPREVRVPACLPRRPSALASRFFAAFDQACGRGTILYAWKAADGMDVGAQHAAQDGAKTGHG